MHESERSTAFDTRAVTAGEKALAHEGGYGDAVAPIHLASTYGLEELDPSMGLDDVDSDAADARESPRLARRRRARDGVRLRDGRDRRGRSLDSRTRRPAGRVRGP